MANVAQWGVDKLRAEMAKITAAAQREKSRLQLNRSGFNQLVKRAASIANPELKARVKDQLTDFIHRQVAAENKWQDFAARWNQARAAVSAFMRSVGLNAPDDVALSGLGAIPLVPVAIAGLVLLAAAYIASIALTNDSQQKSLSTINRLFELKAKGQISDAELIAGLAAVGKAAAKAKESSDPLGLTGALRAAGPVVLLIVLAMLGPKLMPQRRAA
jgi:hypothetical protein